MKKLFLMTAAAIGLFASCENEVNDWTASQNNEITFQTVVSRPGANRALINGAEYGTTAPEFGAFAFLKTGDPLAYNKTTPYINNQKISYQAPNWAPAGNKYYWPKTGSLTFLAYSPFYYQESGSTSVAPAMPVMGDNAASTKGFVFENYDVDAHQLTDLMVATIQKDQSSNSTNVGYKGVPTIFNHKLAQVVGFVFQTQQEYDGGTSPVAGSQQFYVETVTLKQVVTNGTYTSQGVMSDGTLTDESWADAATPVKKDYVWFNHATDGLFGYDADKLYVTTTAPASGVYQSPTIANDYLLVRPQALADDLKVEIKYYTLTFDGTNWTNKVYQTVEKSLNAVHASTGANQAWEMNKRYTYTLTFTNDEILWAPSVVDWTDKSVTPPNPLN